ncbi:MAG: response regulator [Candidatus Cloacimonetes bacterium]|nr:response regulator [Candidatus Cloacimonadota bacterium]
MKGRILVMDDDLMLKMVLERILNNYGFDVVFADNGNLAVEIYKTSFECEDEFDLVLMDLTIPFGMGAIEASKLLKNINPLVKIVIISGYAEDDIILNYQKYGFSSALAKPFQGNELKKIIDDVLEK